MKKFNFSTVDPRWLYLVLVILLVMIGVLAYQNYSQVTDKVEIENVQRASAPAPAEEVPAQAYLFCFRLNGSEGMHVPHLLLSQLKGFNNGIAGYNFALLPNATGAEQVGLLPSGIVFVKVSTLASFSPTLVELKAEILGWGPVAMNRGTVNGEDSYVYQMVNL